MRMSFILRFGDRSIPLPTVEFVLPLSLKGFHPSAPISASAPIDPKIAASLIYAVHTHPMPGVHAQVVTGAVWNFGSPFHIKEIICQVRRVYLMLSSRWNPLAKRIASFLSNSTSPGRPARSPRRVSTGVFLSRTSPHPPSSILPSNGRCG